MAAFVFSVLERSHPEENGTVYRVGAAIGRDVARELGTDLLGWVSSGITSTEGDVYYETVNDSKLYARACDSICEIVISVGLGTGGLGGVPPVSFEMNSDVTIDIGQRLIAFAGPDLAAVMEV
jgi:hypothetical protein